jgi:hypothetical protein
MHVNHRYGVSITIDFSSLTIKDVIKGHNKLKNHG